MAGAKQLRDDEVEIDDELDNDIEDDQDDDTSGDDTSGDDDIGEGVAEGTSDTSDDVDGENDDKTEEEREAIRERRRQERKDKKERQHQKEETARRELAMLRRERDEMRQRLDLLERKSTGSELAQVDAAIADTDRIAGILKDQIRIAAEANDGQALAEATDRMYHVRRRGEDLRRLKEASIQNTQTREQRSPIDPRLQRNAEAWMSKNSWYDPQAGDPDSRVALTIDNAMGEEGWDPRTPEYWDELSDRLKRYLPHRFQRGTAQQQQGQQRQRPRNITTGSGRDSSQGGSSTAFKLSPERVQAMKESGIWEDKEARDKMIANYRKYDKENAKN